jgi:hypothetical protein
VLTSTVVRRQGAGPAGEFVGPARTCRGPKGRGKQRVQHTAGCIEEVLGVTGGNATSCTDAHHRFWRQEGG